MKANLTFKLPEEEKEFYDAINGNSYYIVLWEMDQYLRSKLKYEDLTESEAEVYINVRKKLFDLTSEYGVSFE